MLLLRLLLLLLLHHRPADGAAGPADGDWRAVNALLRDLTLALPDIPPTHLDQPFPVDFSARGLFCSGFAIGALTLQYNTRHNNTENSLSTSAWTAVRAAGLAVNCSGDVNVTLSGLPPGHGRLVAASNASALSFTVALEEGPPEASSRLEVGRSAPVSARIVDCHAAVSLDELRVSGDATMKLLEQLLAAADVKSLVGGLVNPLICKASRTFPIPSSLPC